MHDFSLRNAQINDSEDVFSWRNDPHSRSMFIEQEKVTWETHQNWFKKSLENPMRLILIATSDQKNIAVIRFDFLSTSKNHAVISINLKPECRGKGIAVPLLIEAEKFLPKDCSKISAEIKQENSASIKSFERAGYSITISGENIVTYTKTL